MDSGAQWQYGRYRLLTICRWETRPRTRPSSALERKVISGATRGSARPRTSTNSRTAVPSLRADRCPLRRTPCLSYVTWSTTWRCRHSSTRHSGSGLRTVVGPLFAIGNHEWYQSRPPVSLHQLGRSRKAGRLLSLAAGIRWYRTSRPLKPPPVNCRSRALRSWYAAERAVRTPDPSFKVMPARQALRSSAQAAQATLVTYDRSS